MKRLRATGLKRAEVRLLLAALFLQLLVAACQSVVPSDLFDTDIELYRTWCRNLVQWGLDAAYWGNIGPLENRIDYPPVVPYVYMALGAIVRGISPAVFADDIAMNFVLKLPAVGANVLISAVLLRECQRRGTALSGTVLLLLVFNPALVFDAAYWGQTDSIACLFLLGSLLTLQRRALTWSYVWFSLACFTKPLVWPFSVLVLFASVAGYSGRRILRALAAALTVSALTLLPFYLDGNLIRLLTDLFVHQVDAMPFVSVNAHNVWWLVNPTARSWIESSALLFGAVSYKTTAVLLFLLVYALILGRVVATLRAGGQLDVLRTASLVALSFFMLSPHMHENHLFAFFPLAVIPMLAGGRERRHWRGYVLLVISSLLNMAIHDDYLGQVASDVLGSLLAAGVGPGVEAQWLASVFVVLTSRLNALVAVVVFLHILWQELCGQAAGSTGLLEAAAD